MLRSLLVAFVLALPLLSSASAEDPLELLWGRRHGFAADGSPQVTVRIDEGKSEIAIVPKVATRIAAGTGKTLKAAAGSTWRFRVKDGVPAKLLYAPQVADFRVRDREAALESLDLWKSRGFDARAAIVGGIYGFGGRVIDNRRYAILLAAPADRAGAERLAGDAQSRFGAVASLFEEIEQRPTGIVEVIDPAGKVVARARGIAVVEPEGAGGIAVLRVEHDIGYAGQGREDRTYRGRIFVTVDASGKTAAVGVLPMEELVRGIVPSEIFASAHPEALQAQAVAARGEVLAKIGVRHRADPWLLCAEQHCQVYKGLSGEHPRTDEAIAASRGEALFGHGGYLVDSVYSSTCGGHTEDNEVVWGTPPDP
ncbi:MAG TPA: SpoIID/LytB domain-containing protein, partial [Vulgatibacter sp.]